MRYPRCFIVVDDSINEEKQNQLFLMIENQKDCYFPYINTKVKVIDEQINVIQRLDFYFKKRSSTKVFVINTKAINYMFYIAVLDFNPQFFGIDSFEEYKLINKIWSNMSNFNNMRKHLHSAYGYYWDSVTNIFKIKPTQLVDDQFMKNIFDYLHWGDSLDAERLILNILKEKIKLGILNRLDL